MPEHEFVIYTIGAKESQRGKFRYELPSNIVSVKETFLDEYQREQGEWGHRFRLTPKQREVMGALLGTDERMDWVGLFELLRSEAFQVASDFLMSKDYFDILVKLCRERYDQVPFTEMFWTVRSMILPLFIGVRQEIPEADLYHSVSTGYAGVIGGLAKQLYGKPFILTEHGIYSREREEEIIKADWVKGYFKDLWIEYFYRLSSCAYDYADKVITLFNRNREIEIELGCDPNKIELIPNGVEIEDFQSIVRGEPDGAVRLGAIVRVVPIKDIKTMIHSFALVKQQVPRAELHIMGGTDEDREYYEECLQLVETLQVSDVIFTGEVQVKERLGRMDLLLLSSISEGQPLAILEGLAAGLPFVTTDVGSCRELLEGLNDDYGPAGYVIPVMHYEPYAAAIVRLCQNADLRIAMGRNGQKRVKSMYTKARFIEEYKKLYASLEGGQAWQASVLS